MNGDPFRSMAFTKFFIKPSLMCRGGSRILCHSANAGCCTFFSPTFRDFLWGQSVFRKCKVFPRLSHSHKKKQHYFLYPSWRPIQQRRYLQVTTNMPAILAVFKLIQQLLWVFLGFFQVDSVSDWNGWMLVSIMQQHHLQTQFRRVCK